MQHDFRYFVFDTWELRTQLIKERYGMEKLRKLIHEYEHIGDITTATRTCKLVYFSD